MKPALPLVLERGRAWVAGRAVLVLGVAVGGAVLAEAPVLVAGGVVGALAVTVWGWRYRVVVDDSGVTRRGVFGTVAVPWDEVVGIGVPDPVKGTLLVGRRGAGPVTVSGLPVLEVGEDAGLARIAMAMRQRAGLVGPHEELPPAARWREPWVGRPPRGALWWALPGLVVSAGLVCVPFVHEGVGRDAAVVVGGVLGAVQARTVLLVWRGRTEFGPDGIDDRTVLERRPVPWGVVERIEVLPLASGRRLTVGAAGRVLVLAAPREAGPRAGAAFDDALDELIARTGGEVVVAGGRAGFRALFPALLLVVALVAVAQEGPQYEPWWPGRDEAAALPGACEVLDEATARRMVPDAVARARRPGTCWWVRDGTPHGLRLDYRRFTRGPHAGGIERAARHLSWQPGVPVRRVGDQARAKADLVSGYARVVVTARRANVLVTVEYSTLRPERRARADAAALARRALERVELR